jgi:hypothetical protein
LSISNDSKKIVHRVIRGSSVITGLGGNNLPILKVQFQGEGSKYRAENLDRNSVVHGDIEVVFGAENLAIRFTSWEKDGEMFFSPRRSQVNVEMKADTCEVSRLTKSVLVVGKQKHSSSILLKVSLDSPVTRQLITLKGLNEGWFRDLHSISETYAIGSFVSKPNQKGKHSTLEVLLVNMHTGHVELLHKLNSSEPQAGGKVSYGLNRFLVDAGHREVKAFKWHVHR